MGGKVGNADGGDVVGLKEGTSVGGRVVGN